MHSIFLQENNVLCCQIHKNVKKEEQRWKVSESSNIFQGRIILLKHKYVPDT